MKLTGIKAPVILPLNFIFLVCCIKPYKPDIEIYESAMVIVGELIQTDPIQKVEISISSDYNDRGLLPVNGCVVYVEDDKGNVFNYSETADGVYTCHIEQQYLNFGTSYRLVVNTEDGKTYASKFDRMEECPDIENVYYSIRKKFQGVDKTEVLGVQFYVESKREGDQTEYCRWSLEETWEYRALYENNAKLVRGEVIYFENPVYEPFCWMTKKITSIYTAHIEEHVKPVEINYVTNLTPRLRFKYSLLVRQFGISDDAYKFWDKLGSQFDEGGGLYEKQPQDINSNIVNINNEDEKIIGNFNTASVKEKRIFINGQDLDLDIPNYCNYEILPDNRNEWPDIAYLNIMLSGQVIMSTDSACFDCTARGGTNIKPDFWEEQ